MIKPLKREQIDEISKERDRKAKPVRFMIDRLSVNILTGQQRGGNILNQYVYFDLKPNEVRQIKAFLKENNPEKKVKIIYSKE